MSKSANKSAYIFDVTRDDFSSQVVENSYRLPVLVDFWAAWCQPCQILMPLLKKLADEAQGALLLAKINADDEQALAVQLGVRGLPTVMVFRNGQIVDQLVGVQPESLYRATLERHRTKPLDSLLEQAEFAWEHGNRKRALELLRKAQSLEPDNAAVKIALAAKLLADNQAEAARQLLNDLPPENRAEQPTSGLLARLEFADLVKSAPEAAILESKLRDDSNNCRVRYQLGARKVVEGDYEAALQQFLEILRRDPQFGEGAGRKGLLAIFNILGSDNPLVGAYRKKMAMLLY